MNRALGLVLYPCHRIPDFVYDYIDGHLPKITKLRFEGHISICKDCHEYVLLYKSAADAKAFQKLNPPPAEFLDKTFAFLKSEGLLDEEDEKNI